MMVEWHCFAQISSGVTRAPSGTQLTEQQQLDDRIRKHRPVISSVLLGSAYTCLLGNGTPRPGVRGPRVSVNKMKSRAS